MSGRQDRIGAGEVRVVRDSESEWPDPKRGPTRNLERSNT